MSADPGGKPRRPWMPTVAVIAVVVVAAALVLIILPLLPGPVGPGSSDPPSPTAIEQSPAASPSAPIQREGWASIQVAEPNNYAYIVGIENGKGVVLAFGQADVNHAGVWRSVDGQTWEAGSVPELPKEFGGGLNDITVTEDGYLGLVALGQPQGSEQITSALYTSPDGLVWTAASAPVEGNWVGSAVAAVGSRIVVAGGSGAFGEVSDENSGVFVSDDGGKSWQRTTDTAALGGQITDLVADDSRLVAVGYAGTLETAQPLLWVSSDRGSTWERTTLGEEGSPSHVVVGPGGAIVVLGAMGEDAFAWLLDGDTWSSQRVASCCLVGATTTPTGYVVVGFQVGFPSAPYVAWSTDGRDWKLGEDPGLGDLTGVGWTEELGLLATTHTSVVLAPAPYP